MTPYNYNYESDNMVLFKDLISENETAIKTFMTWENYDLNETVIPVTDLIKEHALMVLSKSYGLFHVEQSILDELCADIFIYFPILLQQLSITRLIDAYGVVKDDTDIIETVRTEILNTEVDQNSTLTQGTSQTDSNVLNTQQKTTGTVLTENVQDLEQTTTGTVISANVIDTEQKTTGTVLVENDTTNTQNSTTNIENSSGVEETGSRNVNINHNMPEQSISGITGNFPVDDQGTPILSTSYVQTAQEGFSTSNPIATSELSEQIIANTSIVTGDNTTTNDVTVAESGTKTDTTTNNLSVANTGNNDTTVTNDLTVADTGTTTRTTTNSGSDSSEASTATSGTNNVNETVTSTLTNKQYAYEIKAFLETADGLIAFKKWENNFSWVVGII